MKPERASQPTGVSPQYARPCEAQVHLLADSPAAVAGFDSSYTAIGAMLLHAAQPTGSSLSPSLPVSAACALLRQPRGSRRRRPAQRGGAR